MQSAQQGTVLSAAPPPRGSASTTRLGGRAPHRGPGFPLPPLHAFPSYRDLNSGLLSYRSNSVPPTSGKSSFRCHIARKIPPGKTTRELPFSSRVSLRGRHICPQGSISSRGREESRLRCGAGGVGR